MQREPRDSLVSLPTFEHTVRWSEWSLSKGSPSVVPGTVGVWRVDLAQPEPVSGGLFAILTDDEIVRARRFVHERHRRRFVVARGALRQVLAVHVGQTAASLVFDYNANGKPALAAGRHDSDLHFNVAHAGDVCLIAVTRGQPIGVDVEATRPDVAWEDIARRFFATEEIDRILAMAEDERPAACCRCWTRKEAIVKAAGSSIPHALRSVGVDPSPWPEWHAVDAAIEDARARWHVRDFEPGPGLTGALAVPNRPEQVLALRWVAGS